MINLRSAVGGLPLGNVYSPAFILSTAIGLRSPSARVTGNIISPFISFANTGIVNITGGQAYRLTIARINYATGIGAGATPN